MMFLHRSNSYACYFGLDTDNQIAAGGWSAGEGNLTWAKFGALGVNTAASRAPQHTGSAGWITIANNSAQPPAYIGAPPSSVNDGASATVANLRLMSWFGIGFGPSITDQAVPQGENALWMDVRTGNFSARGNVTAYSSDERLKNNFQPIQNSLDKIQQIAGYEFDWDIDKCRSLGFAPAQMHEHGVKAQEIQKVVADAVTIAPFDDNGGESRTGENYLTVKYERLVPLLIEAIKELNAKVEELKKKLP
jgi:hypothetical protein